MRRDSVKMIAFSGAFRPATFSKATLRARRSAGTLRIVDNRAGEGRESLQIGDFGRHAFAVGGGERLRGVVFGPFFGGFVERFFQRVGDHVGRLIYISETVSFVDDDEVPRSGHDIFGLVPGEMVGADDERRLVGLERVGAPCFDRLIV